LERLNTIFEHFYNYGPTNSIFIEIFLFQAVEIAELVQDYVNGLYPEIDKARINSRLASISSRLTMSRPLK